MRISPIFAALFLSAAIAAAQHPTATEPATALTIYNDDFAVARTTLNFDLHAGINSVETNQVTNQLEPDSVILRDLVQGGATLKPSFSILEQNYESAAVTQESLLRKYEGQTIKFVFGNALGVDGKPAEGTYVEGKIVRAPTQWQDPNMGYQQTQALIEVNGQLEFNLPGTPFFPDTTDGLLLKPALRWQIESEKAQNVNAELAYITEGMSWQATYNVVAGSGGEAGQGAEKADLLGWVTISNRSGADFPRAAIKLMAGDVAKIQEMRARPMVAMAAMSEAVNVNGGVTQKPFDDFHLYDLHRTVSLADGETKQIQFLQAQDINVVRSYLYDGEAGNFENVYYNGGVNQQQDFGLENSNSRVQVVEEIKNTQANRLGIPLPAGRLRFYRRDADGQLEFVGESVINHTPADDTVKVSTGSAFDVKGSRRQTDFFVDNNRRILEETFEIDVTNQKSQTVNVNVLEHLYRGDNWEIDQKSSEFTKLDSHTIEFPIDVPARGKATVTYKVRYSW